MGSSASKATRTLPKKKPSWSGARTGEMPPPPPSRPRPVASETKTDAIMEDAGDPHLLANLRKLGAVKVDHHMQTASDGTAKMLQTRLEADEEAASFTLNRNHLFSYALTQLLEERKTTPVPVLAEKYNIDAARIESLCRFVNVPTIDTARQRRTVLKNGEEYVESPVRVMRVSCLDDLTVLQVIWVEPTKTA
ncbi:hypothetical protein EV715DRAFT_203559 [Schizophyllum commune]